MRAVLTLILGCILFCVPMAYPAPDAAPDMAMASTSAPDYADAQTGKLIRWHDKTHTILVYIHQDTFLPGWNPEYPTRVQAAFAQWEAAMAPRFHFVFMPDARGADVQVFWTTHLGTVAHGDIAGENSTTTWGKYMARNDIRLSLLSSRGEAVSPAMIETIALHEIGHLLGIKAHSPNPDDIMAAQTAMDSDDTAARLSERDIQTLRRLYERRADITNPPDVRLANFEQFRRTHARGRRWTILWLSLGGIPVPLPLPF